MSAQDLPQQLKSELADRIRRAVLEAGTGRRTLDQRVWELARVLLARHRLFTVGDLPKQTLDQFMSRPSPPVYETIRELNPEMLAVGLGSDAVREWNQRDHLQPGWETLREELRGACRRIALSFLPEVRSWEFDGPDKKLRDRLTLAAGCDVGELDVALAACGFYDQVADAIVEDARSGVGRRPVAEAVVVQPNEHGFYEWRPGIEWENSSRSEWWRPRPLLPDGHKDRRRFSLQVSGAEVEVEVTRERSHEDYEEGGAPVAFHFFLAKASMDGRVVGLVRGELLLDRTLGAGMHDERFYSAAESQTGDLTHLAHIVLTQHMDAVEFFDPGDALYLSHWEVVPEHRGRGLAVPLLKAVLSELRRRHRRLASLVYELHPAQFHHPFDRAWPPSFQHRYDDACRGLAAYLRHIGFATMLSTHGHAVRIDVTPEQEALTDNQRYAVHMGISETSGPSDRAGHR